MFQYRAHSLKIHSDLEFPELTPENFSAGCDVHIRPGLIEALDDENEVNCRAGLDFCDLEYRGVVRARASNHSIQFQALGAEPARLRLFLLNSAVSAVLIQRGRLVLHAGCVSKGGRAVALAGHSGAGKSTATAALLERGYALVSEDQVVLDGLAVATGYPFLRLWPASFQFLNEDAERFAPLSADCPKRLLPRRLAEGKLRLDRILLLEIGPEIDCQVLNPLDATVALLSHSFQARWGQPGFPAHLRRAHFQACSQLAREVPVVRLRRRAESPGFELFLENLIERIQSHELIS